RHDLVTMLVRSLPKDIRRHLIPMNETVATAYAMLPSDGPAGERPLTVALAAALSAATGLRIEAADFDLTRVPPHLRLHIVVVDDSGRPVDAGDDLTTIRSRQAASARSALAQATPLSERRDIVR